MSEAQGRLKAPRHNSAFFSSACGPMKSCPDLVDFPSHVSLLKPSKPCVDMMDTGPGRVPRQGSIASIVQVAYQALLSYFSFQLLLICKANCSGRIQKCVSLGPDT